jgi:hypothetical protein
MNDNKILQLIDILKANGFIYKCKNILNRKNKELNTLRKLKDREGYLIKYNITMRFCFIILLNQGYDIDNQYVHKVFKEMAVSLSDIPVKEISEIIKTRNQIKYLNKPVCITAESNMIAITDIFKSYISIND